MKTVFLFLLFFFLCLQIPDDPDLGVNLGVGRYILSHHTFPRTDLFSFSLSNHPYVYHSWLGQVLITVVYEKGLMGIKGLSGLSLIGSFMAAVGVLLLYRLCKPSFWLFILFVLISTHVFSSIGVRPQMFSFLFLVVEVGILLVWRRYKGNQGNKGNWGEKKLWWLVPLFWVWANTHPGFIVGLLVAIVFIGLEFIGHLRSAIMTVIAIGLVTLLNPYGFGVYRQAWAISQNPFNLSSNLEWVPLLSRGIPHAIFAGVTIVLFLLLFRQKKIDWTMIGISFLLFLFTLRSTRAALPFLVVFLPTVSPFLVRFPNPLANLRPWSWEKVPVYLALVTLPLTVLVRIFTNGVSVYSAISDPQVLANRQGYPYGAVTYMRTHKTPMRLLNYFNWGGYVVWQLPQVKVFETGIMDTFQTDRGYFLDDYFMLVNAKPGWENLMHRYHIDGVLLPPKTHLIGVLKEQPDWQVVYEDTGSILMHKRANLDKVVL